MLLTVLTVMLVGGAKAEFQTGNALFEACDPQSRQYPLCLGYVEGITDVLGTLHDTGGDFLGWRACIPENMSAGQAADVVMKRLREDPEQRHLGAATVVASALALAFPCRP